MNKLVPVALLVLCAAGCWAPTGRERMVGQWSTQASGWAMQVDLSLSEEGEFDLIETPSMMTKPIPTVYMSGTWNRRGSSLDLVATRRVEVGGLNRPNHVVDQFTKSVSISYHLKLDENDHSILISSKLGTLGALELRTPIKCKRISKTPKPIDWPALEKQVLGVGRDPGIRP